MNNLYNHNAVLRDNSGNDGALACTTTVQMQDDR